MSKERLEEIKDKLFFEHGKWLWKKIFRPKDAAFLIQQAEEKMQLEERVKELEEAVKTYQEARDWLNEVKQNVEMIESVVEENQRYKQALESVYSIIQLAHLEENFSEQALKQIENLVIDSWESEGEA